MSYKILISALQKKLLLLEIVFRKKKAAENRFFQHPGKPRLERLRQESDLTLENTYCERSGPAICIEAD